MSTEMSIKLEPTIKHVFESLRLTPQAMERKNRWTLTSFTAWGIRETQKAFTNSGQGQPGGEMWRGLSQAWAERKTTLNVSPLIGIFSGKMRQSVGGEENFSRGTSTVGVGGRSEEYTEYFNEKRPILPEDHYAANKFQSLYSEALVSNRV